MPQNAAARHRPRARPMPPLIHLHAPTPGDVDDLLDFEQRHRAFFESMINARPAGYYSRDGVAAAIDAAGREARDDTGYQYLVRDEAGHLVGRVNLAKVRRAHFHCADLGYRVAQDQGGRGIASEAVRQVLAIAFGELGLARVEASVRVGNAGSLRVLQRNGFTEYGRSRRSFELAGEWHDRLHFERHAVPLAEASPTSA